MAQNIKDGVTNPIQLSGFPAFTRLERVYNPFHKVFATDEVAQNIKNGVTNPIQLSGIYLGWNGFITRSISFLLPMRWLKTLRIG